MKAVEIFLAVWITITTGITMPPRHEGCFSTSFVQQYASYYRLNQSLPLQECIAACNNRLTHYIGLEVDQSSPAYNYVFCGNDLSKISPKTHNDQCNPCQENRTYACGRNGTMSVYLLRDSTPLSLLLATDRGVEMLSDNVTTLRVAHYNTSHFKYVDYIYTEDMIISAIHYKFLRSFYNALTMKFSQHYIFRTQSYNSSGLAIDFLTRYLYYGHSGYKHMYKGNTQGIYSETKVIHRTISFPEQITIDPYNRSLVFLEYPYNTINIYLWQGNVYSLSLNHVEKINALSSDIQEKLLYAILTFIGDSSAYLVSLDYRVSQMRVLFSGPQLVNATVLEVFRDDAVWLRNINGVSTIFQCKLTPRCQVENITVQQSNQKIYDFSIYHPEKQTPGRKRLCANMTCPHGCQLFSPFTARCSCPTGMEMDPDNSTCVSMTSSTQTFPTTGTVPATNDEVNYEYESSINSVDFTTVRDMSTVTHEDKVSKKNNDFGLSFSEICIIIMLFMLIGITILVVDLYRKNYHVTQVLGQRVEMKSLGNHYVEVPLIE